MTDFERKLIKVNEYLSAVRSSYQVYNLSRAESSADSLAELRHDWVNKTTVLNNYIRQLIDDYPDECDEHRFDYITQEVLLMKSGINKS